MNWLQRNEYRTIVAVDDQGVVVVVAFRACALNIESLKCGCGGRFSRLLPRNSRLALGPSPEHRPSLCQNLGSRTSALFSNLQSGSYSMS